MNWSGDTLATFHVLSVSGPIKVYPSDLEFTGAQFSSVLAAGWSHRHSVCFPYAWQPKTVAVIWTQDGGDLLTLLPRATSLAFQTARHVYPSSSQLLLDSWRGPRASEVSSSWCPVSHTQCWTLEEPCLPKSWISHIKHWQLLPIVGKTSFLHRLQIHPHAAPTGSNSPGGLSIDLLPQTTYRPYPRFPWTWWIFA